MPCSKTIGGFIVRPRLVRFAGQGITPILSPLSLNHTTFYTLPNTFVAFVGGFFFVGTGLFTCFLATSFFFCACCSAFSSALTSSILSSLAIACRAFSAFLIASTSFFKAVAALFASIRALSAFLNASFSAVIAYAWRTTSALKSIGSLCSLPRTFSFFPCLLHFFSSFKASRSPSFVC